MSEVTVRYAKHPITISVRGTVGQQVDGEGSALESWLVCVDRESKGLVSIDIQHEDDLDELIDKLLEHRTKMKES